MPRKQKIKPPKVELTPAQKKVRREQRRLDRIARPKDPGLDPNFTWEGTTYGKKFDTRPHLYIHRCSVKVIRESENSPMSPAPGAYHQFRDAEGQLRWMCSYKKRSEREDMLLQCKELNGRKARKEPKREPEREPEELPVQVRDKRKGKRRRRR